MKIKTATACEPVLDYLVAKALNVNVVAWKARGRDAYFVVLAEAFVSFEPDQIYKQEDTYYPTTDCAVGEVIIDEERIGTWPLRDGSWAAAIGDNCYPSLGPMRRIAAMRCLVSSKLGDEVDVPEELCQ